MIDERRLTSLLIAGVIFGVMTVYRQHRDTVLWGRVVEVGLAIQCGLALLRGLGLVP